MRNEDKFITEARLRYNKIGFIKCSALAGQLVYFNNRGFKHILRKKGITRTRKQIYVRISLIESAVQIITKSKRANGYREMTVEGKVTRFWQIEESHRNIRVVIRQIDTGRLHFFSVMKCKTKPR